MTSSIHNYFQLFSWQQFDLNNLRHRLYTSRPLLIEWICIEEISTGLMPEYRVFCEYLDSNPAAHLHILVSTPDIEWLPQRDRVEYEPYIVNFFHQAKHHIIDTHRYDAQALPPPVEFTPKRFNYKFCALNHRGHIFRCKIVDEYARQELFQDDVLISWNNVSMPDPNVFQFKYFTPRKIIIPGDNFYNSEGSYNSYRLPAIYNDAAFSVIAESSPDQFFVTEKTTTALWFYKPFIIFGSVGFNHYLRDELGFKIFEEVFDYSFDYEKDLDQRVEGFVREVKKLSAMSLDEISDVYAALKDKIIHNRHRAYNILYDQKFWPKKFVEWKKYMYDKSVTIGDTSRKDLFVLQTEHMFNSL